MSKKASTLASSCFLICWCVPSITCSVIRPSSPFVKVTFPEATVLTSAGGGDVFVARYGADGSLQWAKSAGGLAWDGATGIGAAADGSVLVGGEFSPYATTTATFGAGEPNETVLQSAGNADVFVARFEGGCP